MAAPKPLPWHEVYPQLLKERGLTQEDAAFEARRQGARTISSSVISKVRSGQRKLKPEFLEALAGAIGAEPDVFLEYRLAKTRELFDEAAIGLPAAAANLTGLEDALAEIGLGPPKGGEIERRMTDGPPTPPARSQSRTPPAARRRKAS